MSTIRTSVESEVEKKKITLPSRFDYWVSRRNLDWSISDAGDDVIKEFLLKMGLDQSFRISTYAGRRRIRQLVTEMGFTLLKNKRRRDVYLIYKKGKAENIPSFSPEMLMIEEEDLVEA